VSPRRPSTGRRAFVAYTVPSTGEVVPLLQVVPSKTDRERLLVVSPELADVLAAVIARVRAGHQQIPLVARYDHMERVHSRRCRCCSNAGGAPPGTA